MPHLATLVPAEAVMVFTCNDNNMEYAFHGTHVPENTVLWLLHQYIHDALHTPAGFVASNCGAESFIMPDRLLHIPPPTDNFATVGVVPVIGDDRPKLIEAFCTGPQTSRRNPPYVNLPVSEDVGSAKTTAIAHFENVVVPKRNKRATSRSAHAPSRSTSHTMGSTSASSTSWPTVNDIRDGTAASDPWSRDHVHW